MTKEAIYIWEKRRLSNKSMPVIQLKKEGFLLIKKESLKESFLMI